MSFTTQATCSKRSNERTTSRNVELKWNKHPRANILNIRQRVLLENYNLLGLLRNVLSYGSQGILPCSQNPTAGVLCLTSPDIQHSIFLASITTLSCPQYILSYLVAVLHIFLLILCTHIVLPYACYMSYSYHPLVSTEKGKGQCVLNCKDTGYN